MVMELEKEHDGQMMMRVYNTGSGIRTYHTTDPIEPTQSKILALPFHEIVDVNTSRLLGGVRHLFYPPPPTHTHTHKHTRARRERERQRERTRALTASNTCCSGCADMCPHCVSIFHEGSPISLLKVMSVLTVEYGFRYHVCSYGRIS